MKKSILVLCAFAALTAQAGMSTVVRVVGKVGNFNSQYVMLDTPSGQTRIPKNLVPLDQLRPGKLVRVEIDFSDLMLINPPSGQPPDLADLHTDYRSPASK